MTEPRIFVALKAFIERDGKILVLREASAYNDGTNAGKYDVPGGRLKPGERFDDVLIREVLEETGLNISFGTPFYMGEWRPVVRGEQWQVVATFVRCTSPAGDVRLSDDHDAYEWIDPTQHRTFPLVENLHPVFEAYLQGKN